MSDSTNVRDDETAIGHRLRAAFEAEAATLEARHKGSVQPKVSVGFAGEAGPQIVSPRGWHRVVLPIAAAIVVMLGLFGVARLAQPDGESEVVAPEQSGLLAAGETEGQPQDQASAVAATQTDESDEARAPAMPTVAPEQADLNLVQGSPQPDTTVSVILELCVTNIAAPDTLNVRNEPSIKGALLGELQPGQCGIIQMSPPINGWTSVNFANGRGGHTDGWVSARYMTPAGAEGLPGGAPEYCVTNIVAPDTLTLRTGPSVDAVAVAKLKPDRCGITRLAPPTSGWLPIQVTGPLGSLYVGYISERFVAPAQGGILTPGFQPNMVDRPWCAVSGTPDAGVTLQIAPSAESRVVADLAPTECQVFPTNDTDATGQWTRVSVATIDRGGWVPTQTLRPTEQFVEFDATTQRIRVRFDLRFQWDPTVTVNPEHFRVVAPDGRTIGTLSEDATIDLPVDIDPETIGLVGYLADKYCVTSGRPVAPSNGTYPVSLLPRVCA